MKWTRIRIKTITDAEDIIISDLYDIGIVGNYGKVPRFIFMGDRDIDPLASLTIHYPLIKFFRASMSAFENNNKKNNNKKNNNNKNNNNKNNNKSSAPLKRKSF